MACQFSHTSCIAVQTSGKPGRRAEKHPVRPEFSIHPPDHILYREIDRTVLPRDQINLWAVHAIVPTNN